ncbi:cerebellar degeneration-related protein 2 [Anguilla anguilla]|uniref:cerebellar degeneration-related protein 2 n=1 Tax=Anguilla anguilla TaxID=7936 RepID=UPI0015B2CAA1|nr:cerebellar degeneration-related protein 2 [Anguilla anguilla]XP_035261243.1 cerebellar degeneration-related protein 2 [Anguilla anguilla]XP_035261244.1 cerebellar degeneration-related protein 2 [Anguilla anguilla]
MLTDMIVEEEFEIKDEEPWYDQQDLEHDLHLAAELGKTLLDRNRELEQGLKQMYSTNQEQLQEIEYLTKQVDLLRQMNEQHAKVYEQLDTTARDLEQGNHRLVLDNRSAQHKIQGLTEMIESLQAHVEELQQQVEEMKTAQSGRSSRDLAEQRRALGAQSMSCLKELYSRHKYLSYDPAPLDVDMSAGEKVRAEEENLSLHRSVQSLQTQLGTERARRREVEQEAELMARENGELEQRLEQLEGCQARLQELEGEVEELRQLWRADAAGARRAEGLLPDAIFFPPEEPADGDGERDPEDQPEQGRRALKRCSSETALRSPGAEEMRRGHERTCARRAEAVKQRGISLLNEVDAQYSALQVKYEELLRRCQQGTEQHSHKAVQTHAAQRCCPGSAPSPKAQGPEDDAQQPEYKALFQEIFSCIQKTKEGLSESRAKLTPAQ